VNNKYDCFKLHHVGYLIKQIDDARNHKYKIDENSKRCAKHFKASKAAFGRLSVPLVAARYTPLQVLSWMLFSEL
jgi:hypothetical protein